MRPSLENDREDGGREARDSSCVERFVEAINDAVFIRPIKTSGSAQPFSIVNGVACEMLGYSRAELLKKTPLDFDPNLNPQLLEDRERLLQNQESTTFSTVLLGKNGTRIVVEINSRLLNWDGRNEILSIVRDVTKRNEVEAALRESERRFREMMENARLIAIILDVEGRALFVNRFLLNLTGRSAQEVIGKDWFAIFHSPSDAVELRQKLDALIRGACDHHHRSAILTAQGERKLIDWNTTTLCDSQGHVIGVSSIGEDITERKRAELAQVRLSQQMQSLLDSTDEGIYGIDREGRCTFINRAGARMIDYSPQDVLGRNMHSLVHHRRSNSSHYAAHDCPVFHGFESGEGCRVSNEVFWRRDGSSFPVEYSSHPIRSGDGITGAVVTFTDISERQRLEQQLRQAQKMEAIGQLAGGVAHDFNNILASILMRLGVLQRNPQLTTPIKEAMSSIEGETMRAASLTRQLLLFSRRQAPRVEALELNGLIQDLLKMLRRLIGESIEIAFLPASEALWVRADSGMIEQAVMNLCLNSRDAMPAGGELTLSTNIVDCDDDCVRAHSDARPGRFVQLTVTDTGCGMNESVLKHIFEPFFTTKEVGKGTGLGLATVFGIVKQHEGWIRVESSVGQGSSFSIHLPWIPKPETQVAALQTEPAPRGKETILLVEDDPSFRRTAALCLRYLGYTVREAANGREAIARWQEFHAEIELLLADMVMPGGITGQDLARRFRVEKPTLAVVITSGYNEEMMRPDPDRKEFLFLPKPCHPDMLAQLIRKALGGPKMALATTGIEANSDPNLAGLAETASNASQPFPRPERPGFS